MGTVLNFMIRPTTKGIQQIWHTGVGIMAGMKVDVTSVKFLMGKKYEGGS
jgi:hypothetical protein